MLALKNTYESSDAYFYFFSVIIIIFFTFKFSHYFMVRHYQKKMHIGWISPSGDLVRSCSVCLCGSVVSLRLKHAFVQYCGGASCGRCGAGAAACGFDPRQ